MGIVQLTEKPYLCTRNLIKHNYMVKRYYILFLVFAFVLQVHAQQDEMRQTVAYLASQELGGRYPGTAGDSLASAYIVDQLRSLKLKPIIKAKKEKGFYQDFNFTKKEQEITTHNILAVLPGKDKQLRNEYIVVGSHYDHVPVRVVPTRWLFTLVLMIMPAVMPLYFSWRSILSRWVPPVASSSPSLGQRNKD